MVRHPGQMVFNRLRSDDCDDDSIPFRTKPYEFYLPSRIRTHQSQCCILIRYLRISDWTDNFINPNTYYKTLPRITDTDINTH